ncbi:MAG: endonuclease III [Verrucomicrobiales bacterium]|nr:endonuclease III [Verrucomicrobiales bacterium]
MPRSTKTAGPKTRRVRTPAAGSAPDPRLRQRVRQLITALRRTYPNAHCELAYSNPLELLIATILSAQCTDKRVNMVTAELFKKYRTAADYANAPLAELEQDIKTTGFYRNKARNIQACCRALVERHGGEVPRTMEALTALDGVGRKTANVVLGNAFGINDGIVVDTHVVRLARRLGLSRQTDPNKIEQDLMQLVPRPDWTLFSHWLIWHGRRRCFARKPDCAQCELARLCPSAGKV